jgi:hypothetical protein
VLDPDVPQGDVLEQVPVLVDRVVEVGRDVGVVVDVVRRAARWVASKYGDLPYQGPKYRVLESGISAIAQLLLVVPDFVVNCMIW